MGRRLELDETGCLNDQFIVWIRAKNVIVRRRLRAGVNCTLDERSLGWEDPRDHLSDFESSERFCRDVLNMHEGSRDQTIRSGRLGQDEQGLPCRAVPAATRPAPWSGNSRSSASLVIRESLGGACSGPNYLSNSTWRLPRTKLTVRRTSNKWNANRLRKQSGGNQD